MRPEPIRLAEKAIWTLLLGAAAGLDRTGEMEQFFNATSTILSTNSDNMLVRDWFLKRNFHILQFMNLS
jgi:hypothetical protein